MSGTYLSQLYAEVGRLTPPAAFVSQIYGEVAYRLQAPGGIEIHAIDMSISGSYGSDLEATRLHIERDQFLVMEDTPDTYNGASGQFVVVSEDELRLEFTNDLGQALGEIWVDNNVTGTVLSASGTWAQVEVFGYNGESNECDPDYANHHIEVTKAGIYLVVVSASIQSGIGSGGVFEIEARKNNGATRLRNIHTHRQLAGGGGDVGSISMSGLASLVIGDTLEIWVRNETSSTDITFEDINLSVYEVGIS
jgi:hypothetical protein